MPGPKTTKNIYQRIASAMEELDGRVEKGGQTNFGSSYKYVKTDDLVNSLRRVFVSNGLALTHDLVVEDRAGKGLHQCYRFRLVNIDDPADFVESLQVGTANDDKAQSAGTCLSYAVKNFLLKTFMLAGDDKEAEAHQEETDRRASQSRTKPRAETKKKQSKAEKVSDEAPASLEKVQVTDVEEKVYEAQGGDSVRFWSVCLSDGSVTNTQSESTAKQAEILLSNGADAKAWTSKTKQGNLELLRLEAA